MVDVSVIYTRASNVVGDWFRGSPAKTAPLVFLSAIVIYTATELLFGTFVNAEEAYYPALADAFLHQRLDLDSPAVTDDLAYYDGRWFVPFPPLPALLMIPQAAIFGYLSISMPMYTILLGSLSVTFVYLALSGLARRSLLPISHATAGWLTLAFGLGSVNWYMSLTGSVWFSAQVAACAMSSLALVLAIWAPLRWAPLAAGSAIAAAVCARPTALPYVVAVVAILMLRKQSGEKGHHSSGGVSTVPSVGWVAWIRTALPCLIPPLLAIAALAVYNYVRFGSPTEFGYSAGLENVDVALADELATFGQFNLVYLPQNIWAALFAGLDWDGTLTGIRPDMRGLSMLFTMPVLVYLWRARRRATLSMALWASVAMILVPLLLYYNTGANQFGYRFSLDFLPLGMVLLGFAFAHGVPRPAKILILYSIGINLVGTAWWLAMMEA